VTETLTRERKEITDLVKHIGDRTVAVTDLPKQFDHGLLAQAWIEGVVEFGRRTHVFAGRPGTKAEFTGNIVILEDGVGWSGPKNRSHCSFAELIAREEHLIPGQRGEYGTEFKKYVPLLGTDPTTQRPYGEGAMQQVKITEAEALKELRLQVRVTDGGFSRMRA
jgi:hypothetical protein